jgi:hypothetical protein
MPVQAREGPGRFQWGAGSWFGTQIGATLWLVLLGLLMLGQGRTTGAVVLALALAVNGLGVFLWSRRATREPYPSIQLLLGSSGIVGLISVLLASPGSTAESGFQIVPSLPTLLVYPGLMLVVHIQERLDRKSDD